MKNNKYVASDSSSSNENLATNNLDLLNKLNNASVILCNTSHPGNIGSTARAMKTMGLTNLILVKPQCDPDDHAIALASNAGDVVKSAKILNSLDEALNDVTFAIALTSRKREFQNHIYTPNEIMPIVIDRLHHNEKIAFIFGSEKNGLTIEQLEKCNKLVTIPGNPQYFSLNLAQAVQIICYELYFQFINLNKINNENNNYHQQSIDNSRKNVSQLATFADTQGILNHLEEILTKIDFYKNKDKIRTRRNLQHIINKASLERDEVDLLRGILRKLEQQY